MRLYLSSYKIGNKPEELVRLVGNENKKVAIINNAIDYTNAESRLESLTKQLESISSLGFIPEEVDLRNYFNKEKELQEKISEFGMVWVRGGNTFLLRRAFRQSGFDKIIKEMLEKDAIVYGGYSAGICILSPTLKGLDTVDDPNNISEDYDKEIIWEGLNIINYSIAPHYKSDHPESADVDKEVAYMEENNLPYKTLRDGEVIVIEGEKETIFSL